MSQENVAIAKRVQDAFATGGFEATLAFYPTDTVVYPFPEWVEEPLYRGHDGLRTVAAWMENFDDFEFEIEEYREVEGDGVLVLGEMVGRTKDSGVLVRQQFGCVYADAGRADRRVPVLPQPATGPGSRWTGRVGLRTMSDENVEVVRWMYEKGFVQRTVDVPGSEDRVAPDYRFHTRPDFPGPPAYRIDQLVDLWADLDATFIDYSLIPESYEAIGPGHVLVTLCQTTRLRGSDQQIVETIYMLWRLTEGRAQETWTSTDKEQVLKAGGLSE